MASGGRSQTVAQFLELIEKRKYKKATEELSLLVQRAGALQEAQPDAQQHKAFKKLTNLMNSKEAVQSMLSLVISVPTTQLPLLLESFTKLSAVPTFAEQLEAWNVTRAVQIVCEDLLPGAARDWGTFPEKLHTKIAVAEALPGLCTALWTGSFMFRHSINTSRLLFRVLDASTHFARSVNLSANSEEEVVAFLEGSLTNYAVFIQTVAGTRYDAIQSFRDKGALQATGQWFLLTFRRLQALGQQLERASPRVVSVYKTSLVTCLEAWASSRVVYHLLDESSKHQEAVRKLLPQLEEPLRTTFEQRLKICEMVSLDRLGIGESTCAGSLYNVKQWISKLSIERARALAELREPDCFGVLQAYLIANKDGAEVDIQSLFKPWAVEAAADLLTSSDVSAEDALFSLKLLDALLRGTDLLGQGSEALFRGVGIRTLEWAQRPSVQLSAEDCAALLRVLMTCFESGGEQGVRTKRTALVQVLLKHCLELHSEPAVSILAWDFLRVVLGDEDPIGTHLIDQWDPHCLRDGLRPLCTKPPVMSTDLHHSVTTWLDLDEATRDALVVCSLEASARMLSLAAERRTDLTMNWGECGRVLEKCMWDERLIREVCRPRVPLLLTSISDALAATHEQLDDGTDPDYMEVGGVLFVLLNQCCTHSEAEFAESMQGLDDVARAKGVLLGALVVRGFKRGLYDEPPACEHREWLELLLPLVGDIWGTFAADLGLKECSNLECSEGVLEAFKGEFRKCAVCEQVQYCSRNCQKVHWKKEHRDSCTRSSCCSWDARCGLVTSCQ